jgi:tetratricopeptide (TPR) repeat protein
LAPSIRIVACTAALESEKATARDKLSGNDRASGHLQRALAYRAVGDDARATADFEAAIRLFDLRTDASKLDAQYFLQRGIAHHAIGDASKAISDYAQTIWLQPANARAYANRGIVLATHRALLKDAIADFTRALELSPDNVDVLLLRANAYLGLAQVGAAKADAQRAVELGPDNPRAFLMRGLALARQGDLDQAFGDYSEAIRLEPRYADALANRAAILSIRGDFDNAIRDLDAALAAAPNHATAAYNRGYAYFAKRQYDKAMADYTLATQADRAMGWAFANRGLTRAILGKDLPQALADIDTALKLLPNNAEVRETRGFVLLKKRDIDGALSEYELALRSDPNRPLALFGRGLARIAKGEERAGKADQAAARALMPNVDREFETYGIKER